MTTTETLTDLSPDEAAGIATGYDVEFFWDPLCPWAWITSRWVAEVARQRDLKVDWRFISLRFLNAEKFEAADADPKFVAALGTGTKLLRVAAAVRAAGDRDRMAALYTQFGGDIHVRGRRDEMVEAYDDGLAAYLASVGVEDEFLAAANDESWDEVIKAETEGALSRAGKDVGTPIITFERDGQQYSFFGPVINKVPAGEDALRLWDAMWELATFPGFAELKRSLRGRPEVESSLDLEQG